MRGYAYDKARYHLTATDRRAMATMLGAIGTANSIGSCSARIKYSLSIDPGCKGLLTIQTKRYGVQYAVPLTFS
jgi:hypothetical protein